MAFRLDAGLVKCSCFLAALVCTAALAGGQTTGPTTNTATAPSFVVGPLEIRVTAVQGGGQYRTADDSHWRKVVAGLQLAEGAQFRTGPKGSIQFTVGTDQVYRVDRLSSVTVLRASLQPDGTIRTDVGMTYGRVSKDLDQPELPHDDTILAPSSTLAVRGTRVALYDQPPYAPEAVSLTGAADFTNIHGLLVHLGTKGGGKVAVGADAASAAEYQMAQNEVDPLGAGDAGRTQAETKLISLLGGVQGTQLGVFGSLVSGKATPLESVIGSLPVEGELFFGMNFVGNPFVEVNYTVTSPLGEVVSRTNTMVPSGGVFETPPGSFTGDSSGSGFQQVDWVNAGITYPPGTYTVTQTLLGTSTQTLAQNPSITAETTQANVLITISKATGVGTNEAKLSYATLSSSNPTVQYQISAPFAAGTVNKITIGQASTTPPGSSLARLGHSGR